tara:strand:+ start:1973 stop:2179 length:207 start_codon:yes stop_codon:yes gene_type:complete
MIRLPSPPRNIGAPSSVLDFYNKLNEMITFQQNLISGLEFQQTQNDFSVAAGGKSIEDSSDAKAWFNG